MATTNITTLGTAVPTKYKRGVIKGIRAKSVLSKFAVSEGMERGEGNTVRWPYVQRIDKQTTFNLAETTATNTPKAITTDMLEDSIKYVGDSLQLTRAAQWVTILEKGLYQEELTDQIHATLEYLTQKYVCLYGIHHRVDNDSTYEVNATVTTATSTTAHAATALTQADDFWGASAAAHGYWAGTAPAAPNYNRSTLVTDFATTGDVVTTDALPQNNSTSTTFHIVRGTGIVATDKLTYAAIARVAGYHEGFQTKQFPGGIYHGVINSEQHADLYTDTTFTSIMTGVEGMKEFGQYRMFRIAGTEFIVLPNDLMYREDADGTENTGDGAVINTPIFGRDAFAISKWEGGEGDFGLHMHFIGDKADSGNYWAKLKWINWDCSCSIKVLRATSVITLMTGATAQALTTG